MPQLIQAKSRLSRKIGTTSAAVRSEKHNETSAYLREQIITYIGNKRSLLPFIGKGLNLVKRSLGRDKLRVLDLFAGTGVVSRFMKQHASCVIANDLETYSNVTNNCYLTNKSSVQAREMRRAIRHLQDQIIAKTEPGFITELYAPEDDGHITKNERAFYTRRNAIYLDTARKAIDELPKKLQPLFLGPLLAEASIHTNTSGVFKGFYKSKKGVGQFGGQGQNALSRILSPIKLRAPVLSNFECDRKIYQQDANTLVDHLKEVDVAYLDPPYNQHPYGSNYFMLNLLCDYKPPQDISAVSGIPVDWNRSKYNQRQHSEDALFQVIENCNAKFIMISYNSEGFITPDRFLDRLGALGKVTTLETPYNTFRGSRNLRQRAIHVTEFLYLLKK
jgi:adenine-specific DNA-methyltransferase